MRRVVRASREQWWLMAGLLPLSLLVIVVLSFAHASDPYIKPATFAILLIGVGWIVLDTVLSRAIVDGETIRFLSPLPSRRLSTRLADVVHYRSKGEGDWRVESQGRTVRVPFQSPWALHAAMVEFAPTKLGAKRLRPLHLPPTEEFRNLWTLDTEMLLAEAIWRIVVCLAIAFSLHAGAAALGGPVALLLLALGRAGGRLDVTGDGLVFRTPVHRTAIAWNEATAIFCENPGRRRAFVVTAPGRGIELPSHLARDVDLMRKVFRSLPEGTLCVNFDESTFRGYRRRKKPKEKSPARSEDLMPALTAASFL